MKVLFASLFAALFAFASVASYAAVQVPGGSVYNSDDSKDDAKIPTTGTDQKSDEDDKKKPDEDDKKS
jgi:hypothetical protein